MHRYGTVRLPLTVSSSVASRGIVFLAAQRMICADVCTSAAPLGYGCLCSFLMVHKCAMAYPFLTHHRCVVVAFADQLSSRTRE